ncbi:LysR family transcriptional regulator [Massilia sp.]|uniref:LysR family transcriptional regulator n=1 Tax=Massilia sp. TaxID=1882437 RepID=UPI0028AAF7FC|nr:LysR family transcriptional regulator [Massilia sp.]
MMTLDQLRIFVAVAERQHLTQAAAALSLTPSAVSAQIKALEERYGTPLFNRIGRRIETSEAGRLFLQEARRTLASARSAEQTLADLSGLKRGWLAIQASQTIASYWLPPWLVAFRKAYPQIELAVTVDNTDGVARALLEGAADIGLVEGEIAEAALAARPVTEDRMVVVTAPDHPWADGRKLGPADLLAASWILREQGSGTRSAFEAALRALGVAPESLAVALTLPSNEALRSAVLAGPFATAVSELVLAADLESGRLVKANLELAPRAFWLLRHRERYRSRASLAFEALVGLAEGN